MSYKFIVAILLVMSASAFGEDYCLLRTQADNVVEYNTGSQKINIVGWTHPTQIEMNQAADTLNHAAKLVNNCAKAEAILRTYLQTAVSRSEEANRVVKKLQSIYDKKRFNVIGVEYSPEEWEIVMGSGNSYGRLNELARSLSLRCPSVKKQADTVAKITSPELYFAKIKNGQIQVKPMESQKLKLESAKGVSDETLNFDPDKEVITPAARKLIAGIQDQIRQGKMPSSQQIQDTIDTEANPAMKEKLRRMFTEMTHILSLVGARNTYIAESAISNGGDLAIVIGNAHVNDLAKVFDSACRRGTRLIPPRLQSEGSAR